MKNINALLILLFVGLVIYSCKSTPAAESDYNYLQNIEQIATEASIKNSRSTIQIGDQLVILVSGRDLDVVKPFNQNYSSGEMVQNSVAGGNTPNAGMAAVSGPTYTVDTQGNIDFPHLGRLSTTGQTVEELKDQLTQRLKRFIIDPTVSMRLANYKVTVLGEVNRPGQYIIPDGQTTMLNAIGLAGDLTIYGKRNDILVVRNQNGEVKKERINLSDASFINSEYYYLKQGDVVYVSANRNRELTSKQNPNTPLYISIASVALGLMGVLVSVIKK